MMSSNVFTLLSAPSLKERDCVNVSLSGADTRACAQQPFSGQIKNKISLFTARKYPKRAGSSVTLQLSTHFMYLPLIAGE